MLKFRKKTEEEAPQAAEPALRDKLPVESAPQSEEETEATVSPAADSGSTAAGSEAAGGDEREEHEPTLSEMVEAAYCLGAGIDAETLSRAKDIIRRITEASTASSFNPEGLQLALRLLSYERDIEEAERRGYEAASTERVAAAFRDRRSRAARTEAIPHLGGTPEGGSPADSIFSIANSAK